VAGRLIGVSHAVADGFRFHAAPVKVEGFGTFPVRARAELDG
jgi:kynurenine formamidase